jgi:hypothetical protein
MTQYKTTIALLDRLIAKLQANTGGEPLLPEELIPTLPDKDALQLQTLQAIQQPISSQKDNLEKK